MLQDAGIARHQSRRGKAEDLPERKVPGHHGQDHTQRLEGHKTPAGLGLHDFWHEELRRLLGIKVTDPGTLLHFYPSIFHWFAHLLRREQGIGCRLVAEALGGLVHPLDSFGHARLSPAQESVVGLGNGTCHLSWCHLLVGLDSFPRRGVDSLYSHGEPPGSRAAGLEAATGTAV